MLAELMAGLGKFGELVLEGDGAAIQIREFADQSVALGQDGRDEPPGRTTYGLGRHHDRISFLSLFGSLGKGSRSFPLLSSCGLRGQHPYRGVRT